MTQLDDGLNYLYGLRGRGVYYRALSPEAADPDRYGFADCAGSQCAMLHHVGIGTPQFYMNSGHLWEWCVANGTAFTGAEHINRARTERGWWLFVGVNGEEHVAISTGGLNGGQWAAHGVRSGLGFAAFDANRWFGVGWPPGLTPRPSAIPARLPPTPQGELLNLDAEAQTFVKNVVSTEVLALINSGAFHDAAGDAAEDRFNENARNADTAIGNLMHKINAIVVATNAKL
jgi:hypothetical protein